MGKVAILTDSNSGITQAQSKELGVKVIPMPFFIDGEQYFEDINLTQEEFYEKLQQDADISTSQPSIGEIQDAFDELLKEYDELVYIPMSSGLSGTCQTATMVADDYDGKVQVVNNQRISVTNSGWPVTLIQSFSLGNSPSYFSRKPPQPSFPQQPGPFRYTTGAVSLPSHE